MSGMNSGLGPILRAIRDARGWTLREMSRQVGIPLSTLSKVERGELSFNYDKLQQIADRLQVPFAALFGNPRQAAGTGTRAAGRRSIGSIETALEVRTGNYDYFYLCPELRRKQMVPMITQVLARSMEEFGPLLTHSGEEFIYVVEGRVSVHTEFYDPIVLDVGQCVYIDSNMGHAYLLAPGVERAALLGIATASDEEPQSASIALTRSG